MASITIPNKVLPGFDVLESLDENKFNSVLKYFKKLDITDSFDLISSDINDLTGELNGFELFKTILSFSKLIEKNIPEEEIKIDEIAKELTESFNDLKGNKIDSITLDKVEKRIFKILSDYDNLQYSILIKETINTNENNFISSNVVTDLRPILSENLNSKKRLSTILHKLIIGYQKDSEFKEIQFTLNLNDLKTLKSTIEKAIDNEDLMKTDYSKIFNFIK